MSRFRDRPLWSSNKQAKLCGVSHTFVDNLKRSLATVASEDAEPASRIYTTKHGTTATMNTANIGRSKGTTVTPG
jgi:hypothetical protein